MAIISYPSDITKANSIYITFTRMSSRGFKTAELRNIDTIPFTTKSTDLIALPVPNNLSDTTTINYSNVQDQSVWGNLVDKTSELAGNQAVQEYKTQTGTTKATQQLLLFDSVNLKSFSFNWNLIPETREEALSIQAIIEQFEEAKLPTYDSQVSLKFPDVFKIKIKSTSGSAPKLIKYLPAVITNIDSNIANGVFNIYPDGTFPAIDLTISFSEIVSRTQGIQKNLVNRN